MVGDRLPVLVARCACGEVELSAWGTPIAALACYCDDCQRGSQQLQALPGARPLLDEQGGTSYVLYRKDRVAWVKGEALVRRHKIRESSPTSRLAASCCSSALAVMFDHWWPHASIYRCAVVGAAPALQHRIFTRFATDPSRVAHDVACHARAPLSLVGKLAAANAAMWLVRARSGMPAARRPS